MAAKTKKADGRCRAHQPDFAASQKAAQGPFAPDIATVKPDMRSVLNAWRIDARNRAIQNEYATWVALMAERAQ